MQKTSVRFNGLSQFTQAVGHSVEEGEGRWAGEQKLCENMGKEIPKTTWIMLIQAFHLQILKSNSS